MKTLFKFLYRKDVLILSLSLVFLTMACENPQQETSKKSEVVKVANTAPKMDLHTAILSDRIDIIEQHIKAGSDLNVKEPMAGSTPLITAAVFGKTDAANMLIDAEADLDLKNNDGSTALHVASFFCRTEIVEALLAKGADKSLRNNFGATALESVSAPYDQVAGIYAQIKNGMKPLGLQIDLDYVEQTRPKVAAMLQ